MQDLLTAAASLSLPSGANGWLHVLVADTAAGYTSLAWAQQANKMSPCVSIMGGWYDDATGGGYAGTFTFTDYTLPPMDDSSTR